MKTRLLFIGIIAILALLCSPALAISTSDLISQFRPQGTGTGTLSVTSFPIGAEVYLDGVYKGTTSGVCGWHSLSYSCDYQPLTITGVPIGLHNLRVTLSGYEDYSSRVIIGSDKTVTVHVSLKVQSRPTTIPTTVPTPAPTTVPTIGPTGQLPIFVRTGTVSVSSTPTGAKVFLDGTDRGTTPITLTGVSSGIHKLTVTLSGYKDYSTWVKVQSGKTATVSVTLERPWSFVDETNVRKPNIYLYSDRELTARVRLLPEEAITASEPAYQPGMGWRAEIRNGSLNGAGDFLFYEALVPDSGWQKQEGYVIRGAFREQDMAFMLGEYGFNEKESDDFIEYWASHLAGDRDYVFYSQENDAVNQVMLLSIIPEPDAVSRIWFYAEPLVSAPETVTNPEKIVREGFSVVEWGVMIRDEFCYT